MEGKKMDSGKRRWSLLPMREVQDVVDVLEFGARKYSPDNWMWVPDARTRYYDAAMRHLQAWFIGEVHDTETKKNHLAHAVCCLLFLMWFDRRERRTR